MFIAGIVLLGIVALALVSLGNSQSRQQELRQPAGACLVANASATLPTQPNRSGGPSCNC